MNIFETIQDNVTFVINASFSELQAWLARSKIGIHAMLDEHFGIGVVEYMVCWPTNLYNVLALLNN